MISPELKDNIREATDIVEIISSYVSLKSAGKNFKGLCPFHQEKTPSFSVNPHGQYFHCFGCGIGGDVFDFLMRAEGLSFMEAMRELAGRAHIACPETGRDAQDASGNLRQGIKEVMEWTAGCFQKALADAERGNRIRTYLQKRGLSKEVWEKFGLGYAPPGWNNLLKAARRDHYSEDMLTKAGLIVLKEAGQGSYDRFRDRLIFPIRDHQGRIVAFGGRILGPGEPKYLNSPETLLYHKGELLYGLDLAREAGRRKDCLVLVEGYMDVIAVHMAGVIEVVAGLGTALTNQQARLIKRYARKVILIYDMDEAGINAGLRAFEILNREGLTVRAVRLEGAKDPDEFIRKKGAVVFRQVLSRAVGMPEFIMEAALTGNPAETVEAKVAVVNRVGMVISQLQNGIERKEYTRILAERLRLDERTVAGEVAELTKRKMSFGPGGEKEDAGLPRSIQKEHQVRAGEKLILSTLLRYPFLIGETRGKIKLEDIANPQYRQLAEQILAAPLSEPEIEEDWLAAFLSKITDRELAALAVKLAAEERGEENPALILQDCLKRLEAAGVLEQLDKLQSRIAEVQAECDMEAFKQLAQKKKALAGRLKELDITWRPGMGGDPPRVDPLF